MNPVKHHPSSLLANTRITLAIACVAGLGACALPAVEKANQRHENLGKEAQELLTAQSAKAAATQARPEPKALDYWIGAKPVAMELKRPAPFDSRKVELHAVFSSLADITETLSRDLQAPVRVARETIQSVNEPMTLDYSGSLTGALDKIAARYGISWRATNTGGVVFFLTDTQVYYLNSVATDVNLQISVSGEQSGGTGGTGGAGGSSGSSGDQKTTMSAQLSVFKSMEETVRAMATPGIGRVFASPAGGTLTVTDVPDSLERISAYVEKQNQFLATNVAFDVRVFTVALKQSDDYGFDWNLLFSSLRSNYGVRFLSGSGADATANSFALTIPETVTGDGRRWVGSELVAKALSQQGKVAQMHSATLRTLNKIPVQFIRDREFTYIARSGSTSTANVGVQTSAEPGQKYLGFAVNLVPVAFPDGKVFLQFNMKMSSLNQLRRVQQGSGQSATLQELPDLDRNQSLQQTSLKAGETLVLAGYEQVNDTADKQGVGSSSNTLMGGIRGTTTRDVIVITITPAVSTLDGV